MTTILAAFIQQELNTALTSAQQKTISYIQGYDLSLAQEKILDEGAVDKAIVDEATTEYKKFLILCALGYHGLDMCSKVVDEVWHTHILFTRNYEAFCKEAFGFFLHHQPATSKTPMSQGATSKFVAAYTATYGEPPSIGQLTLSSGESSHSSVLQICFRGCAAPSRWCKCVTVTYVSKPSQ